MPQFRDGLLPFKINETIFIESIILAIPKYAEQNLTVLFSISYWRELTDQKSKQIIISFTVKFRNP